MLLKIGRSRLKVNLIQSGIPCSLLRNQGAGTYPGVHTIDYKNRFVATINSMKGCN